MYEKYKSQLDLFIFIFWIYYYFYCYHHLRFVLFMYCYKFMSKHLEMIFLIIKKDLKHLKNKNGDIIIMASMFF
jgi:hypothetical protein